jgi:hypothetical protein
MVNLPARLAKRYQKFMQKLWLRHRNHAEFSFALHQIQQAIEPCLSLRQTLFSWNQIARALAEKSRKRLPQFGNGMLPNSPTDRTEEKLIEARRGLCLN